MLNSLLAFLLTHLLYHAGGRKASSEGGATIHLLPKGDTPLVAFIMEVTGMAQENDDVIREISGVGGSEFVLQKTVDTVVPDRVSVPSFNVQLGNLDYGFTMNDIMGLDLLRAVRATIDLDALELHAR